MLCSSIICTFNSLKNESRCLQMILLYLGICTQVKNIAVSFTEIQKFHPFFLQNVHVVNNKKVDGITCSVLVKFGKWTQMFRNKSVWETWVTEWLVFRVVNFVEWPTAKYFTRMLLVCLCKQSEHDSYRFIILHTASFSYGISKEYIQQI